MSTPRSRFAALLAAALALAACGGAGADHPRDPDPAVLPAEPSPAAGGVGTGSAVPPATAAAHVVTITTEVQPAGGGPSSPVHVRATVVGRRRHVVVDTPLGPMGEHVVTPDHHWFRLPPSVADPLGFPTDWIHVPLAELDLAGVELPPSLAEVRAPLPDPADVSVGDLVYGTRTITEVVPGDAGDTVVLGLDDGRAVRLQRRPAPAGTTVTPPAGAVDVRELPELVAVG